MTELRREQPRTVCVASGWRHGVLPLACGVMWIGAAFAVGASEMAAAARPASSSGLERGDDLCKLLGPDDFAAVGVKGAKPTAGNNSPPTEYYCAYAGRSSYKGGIELDVILSDAKADAAAVFKTVTQETAGPQALDRAKELGVDEAELRLDWPGDPGVVATIAVRRGKLVFVIGFPSNPDAETQLLSLARTVLQRGAALMK